MVLGEVTPSWSSFTRGSADRDFRLTSFCPGLDLGLEMDPGLEGSWEDGIFSLGLGAEDDDSEEDDEGLGVRAELGLLVDSLEMEPGRSAELRLGLEPLWWSEEGLVLGEEAEVGLGVDEELDLGAADDAVMLGLDMGLLVVGLTVLLVSLRWLLYELRLGSLYRSTVRTFP